MATASINRLCIIGVGLIGGSLARALRRASACGEIIGCGRNAVELRKAVALGVIDRAETDPARAVREADMVVLAVPLGAMAQVMNAVAAAIEPQATLTDVGSAKGSVAEAARHAGLGSVFVPGHPIAGTEKSGVESSFAELFVHRRVILTPLPENSPERIERVRQMWQQAGALVEIMDVRHHDQVLAATSHLPHMLAYTLVDTLARMDEHAEIFRYAAGGFRDFTRIASSDPTMWRDICLANRQEIVAMLERFGADLGQLAEAVRSGDSAAIMDTFSRAKAARDEFTRLFNAAGSATDQ